MDKRVIPIVSLLIIGVVIWWYYRSKKGNITIDHPFESDSSILQRQSSFLQSIQPILNLSFQDRYNRYISSKKNIKRYNFTTSNVALYLIKEFMMAAQFSLVAYSTMNDAIAQGVNQLGASLIGAVNNGNCYAYVAMYNDTQILAIQGTEFVPGDYNIAEVWADLSITPKFLKKRSGIPSFMYVHSGFYDELLDLWPRVIPLLNYNLPIWICGHSLGGVRSMIARYLIPEYVKVRITTFGAPRGANAGFWSYVTLSNTVIERILADNDFAGDWQPLLPYDHPSDSFYWLAHNSINLVTERDELNVSFSDHSILNSYIPKLQRVISS